MKMPNLFVLVGLGAGLVLMNMSGIGGCGAGSAAPPVDIPSGASVSSLSTVPSLDISNLDYSQSSSNSSALVAGLVLKDVDAGSGEGKGLGHGFNQVGSSSRAGCESNMHKREMIRHSQEAQLDRCYPEAMETAGIITIPTDSYGYFRVAKPKDLGGGGDGGGGHGSGGPGGGGPGGDGGANIPGGGPGGPPPAVTAGGGGDPCAGIPADHTDEVNACKAGTEGPGGGEMKMRIGRFGNELRVDMCQGDAGLVNEGTYSANGSIYTIVATRIGQFNGHNDKGTFSATVDLGTTGTVTDGLVALGDGLAVADAQMSGGFGSGSMHFEAAGADHSNIIKGIFNGGFANPGNGKATSFTGKVFTHFGGTSNAGTAKFEFTGSPPAMPLANMIPFNIGPDQKAGFLQTLSMQLGITITEANLGTFRMCPNPDFHPEDASTDADKGIAPMVEEGDTGCAPVTHTGVESFSIANGDDTVGDVATKTQVFTIIANTDSAFFAEVDAFDLSAIANSSGAIAFFRNWDCSSEAGSFTDIDFSTMTDAEKTSMETGMQSCQALETKVRGNNGMGEYNCNEQQQRGDMNNMANNGPPPMGLFGGNCQRVPGGTCPVGGRGVYFLNPKDPAANQYCLISMGGCTPFTVDVGTNKALSIADPDGVTEIDFNRPDPALPATGATILQTLPGSPPCTAICTMEHPDFSKPPAFDPTSSGDSAHGGPPAACVTAFGNPPPPPADPAAWMNKCQGLCSSKPGACAPPTS